MTSSKNSIFKIIAVALLMAGLTGPAIAGSSSEPLKVKATLVWGSKSVPKDKKLTPVGKDLQAKLQKCLIWEHYFLISRKSMKVGAGKTQTVRMSKKCEVAVKRLKGDLLNVKLIGEGKVVVNKRHSLANKDFLVMGGPDENESAWVVVLQFD